MPETSNTEFTDGKDNGKTYSVKYQGSGLTQILRQSLARHFKQVVVQMFLMHTQSMDFLDHYITAQLKVIDCVISYCFNLSSFSYELTKVYG